VDATTGIARVSRFSHYSKIPDSAKWLAGSQNTNEPPLPDEQRESANGAENSDALADGRDEKRLVGTGLEVELQPVKRGRIE